MNCNQQHEHQFVAIECPRSTKLFGYEIICLHGKDRKNITLIVHFSLYTQNLIAMAAYYLKFQKTQISTEPKFNE